jgi:hypothetical protein
VYTTVSLHNVFKLKHLKNAQNDILGIVPLTNYMFCMRCGNILEKQTRFSKSKYCIATHLNIIKSNNIQFCYIKIPTTVYKEYFIEEKDDKLNGDSSCREIFLVDKKYYNCGCVDNECVIM